MTRGTVQRNRLEGITFGNDMEHVLAGTYHDIQMTNGGAFGDKLISGLSSQTIDFN